MKTNEGINNTKHEWMNNKIDDNDHVTCKPTFDVAWDALCSMCSAVRTAVSSRRIALTTHICLTEYCRFIVTPVLGCLINMTIWYSVIDSGLLCLSLLLITLIRWLFTWRRAERNSILSNTLIKRPFLSIKLQRWNATERQISTYSFGVKYKLAAQRLVHN